MNTSVKTKPKPSSKRPLIGAATPSYSITTPTHTVSSCRKRRLRRNGPRRLRIDAPAAAFPYRGGGAHGARATGSGGLRGRSGGYSGAAGDDQILVRRHDAGGRD